MNIRKLSKKLKDVAASLLVTAAFLGVTADGVEALSRAEIARISVKADGSDFRYWEENSAAQKKLMEYVKDVTDKKSRNYIPVEERIAVFDMDGTIIGETTPYYFGWMLYFDRIFDDPSYVASRAIRDTAITAREAVKNKTATAELDDIVMRDKLIIMSGLNGEQYQKAVEHMMNQPVPGMKNLKYGEEVYLPMVEVLSYLKANDFTLYIVSGGVRQTVRSYAKGVIPVTPNHIIGSDTILKATHQGDRPGRDYLFDKDNDEILFTSKELEKNAGATKAAKIAREIGLKPVLSFGNSMGDASMHQYTLSNRKYRTLAFEILCDDVEREYGNPKKAAKIETACRKYGWVPISMRDDWKTIYGEAVEKVRE